MKATLTFNLPEELGEFHEHLEGPRARSVLREMAEWLRAQMKYRDRDKLETAEVREKFFEIMDDHEVEV